MGKITLARAIVVLMLCALSASIWLYNGWGISDEDITNGFWLGGGSIVCEREIGPVLAFNQHWRLDENVIYRQAVPVAAVTQRRNRIVDLMIVVTSLKSKTDCPYYFKGYRKQR
ncbi:MAG: hypothetical protein E7B59_11065 [Enterobacteriaceae bacterium]|nr:hypothetical protein [Enterobacteriaceae bacterium]